jgi:putative heme-binding domain-containing protein
LSSLANGAGEMFADLARDAKFGASKPGQEFLRELAALVGAKNKPEEVQAVLAYIGKISEPTLAFSLVRSLGEGLQKAHSTLAKADAGGKLKPQFAQANQLAMNNQTAEPTRMEAVKLLGFENYGTASGALAAALKREATEPIQLAAVTTLAHFSEPQTASELTGHWGEFSPRVKSQALSALLARPERATALLHAIKGGSVKPGDLTTTQLKFLRTHADKNVRRLAIEVLGETTPNERQAVIDAFQPALSLTGDAAKGREIYVARCSSCHRLGGAGFAVGPDLVTVRNSGKDKLLVNILDPSREVAAQYIAFQIDTKDGESQIGIIANETTSSITLRQAYGREDVIQRSTMKAMKSQSQSLMREGLEAGLSHQDFANLLEYISTADANK